MAAEQNDQHQETGQDQGSDEPKEAEEDDDDGDGGGLISTLISKIDQFLQAVIDLVSGTKLFEAIKNWIFSIFDDALRPVLGVFGRTFLFTPSVAGQEWVKSAWSTAFFFSLGLFALAIVISGARIISAKGVTEISKPLQVLCAAMVASIFSLYFVELCIRISNYVFEGIVRQYLVELGVQSSLLGDPQSNVVDGNILLLATLVSPEQIDAAVAQGHGVSYFLGAAGGILLSGIGGCIIAILALIIGLRYLVLCGLGITGPFYFTASALAGSWEPFAGWLNLFARTLLLQCLFIAGWIMMVAVRAANDTAGSPAAVVGVSAMLVNVLIMLVMVVVAVLIWVLPGAKAVMTPLTLNGGEFIEKAGNAGMRMTKFAHGVGSRFGWEGVQDSAYRVHQKARDMRDFGRDLRNMNRNTPATPIEAPIKMPKSEPHYETPVVFKIETPTEKGGDLRIRVPGSVVSGLAKHLAGSIPEKNIEIQGDTLCVSPNYAYEAKELAKEYCKQLVPYWEAGNQFIVIQDRLPVRLMSTPPNGVNMGIWQG